MQAVQKSECPGGAGHCAGNIAENPHRAAAFIIASTKQENNLRAKFALVGHELHVVNKPDGTRHYEVRRWGQTRTCSTLHDLEGFLAQIGGVR